MGILELKDRLQKQCKGVHISILADSEIAKISNWLKTPFYDLNRTISGNLFKGLPEKTLTLVLGQEHTFKSSFAAISMAEAQKQGYIPIIFDSEGAWTDTFISRWGVDPTNVLYVYSPWVDKIKIVMSQLIMTDEEKAAMKEAKKEAKLKKKKVKKVVEEIDENDDSEETPKEQEKYFIVLDSLGGVDKIKIVEDAALGAPKADQGTLQKEIKSMLKLFLNIVKSKNSIGVMTGHYYGNPSGYGDPEQIGGGKAAKLLPDIIIAFKKSAMKSGDSIIGNNIDAICLKNRIYPPFNESKIELDYQEGLNPYAGIIDIAIEAGIIYKGGAWYTVGNIRKEGKDTVGDYKVQGEAKLIDLLNENSDLMNSVIVELNEWLKDTGFSSVNHEVKELIEAQEKDEEKEEN